MLFKYLQLSIYFILFFKSRTLQATTPNMSNFFLDMHDFVASIPTKPAANLSAKISRILAQPWYHDDYRSKMLK